MLKSGRNTQVSQGKIDARNWGNLKEYTDCLELIHDQDAVQEGSMFMEELLLKMCLVNFIFFL